MGCSSDGRTLAPAGPSQTASIVTTTTAAPPPVVDGTLFALSAPWEDGTALPEELTCTGAGRPPSLAWSGVPSGVLELALVATDLDADNRVHWLVAGIDATLTASLPGGDLPPGAVATRNSAGTPGYDPPCPPAGETHRYQFTLHALSGPLALTEDVPPEEAVPLIQGASVATAAVVGTVTG